MRQHVLDVDVDVVRNGWRERKHLGEPLGRESARLGERVGFCVRVSGELARVSCGEHDGGLYDCGVARDEEAAYAKGGGGRDAFGGFEERLAQILDVLLVT